jgi:hypothetical protein
MLKAVGKNISTKNGDPLKIGYKEDFDFNEVIGTWKTIDGKISKPTSRGRIHYDTKGGAHIVPIEPIG